VGVCCRGEIGGAGSSGLRKGYGSGACSLQMCTSQAVGKGKRRGGGGTEGNTSVGLESSLELGARQVPNGRGREIGEPDV
jgi:hypothetical protein